MLLTAVLKSGTAPSLAMINSQAYNHAVELKCVMHYKIVTVFILNRPGQAPSR